MLGAVVAPDRGDHRAFAESVGAVFYTSVEEALAKDRFDGAIISSPNLVHYPQTLACIAAGLPTLVEKPLADRLDTAKAMVDAAERTGVPVMVGHHRAHSPLLQTARDFIRSSEFGRLVTVQGSAQFYKPADYFAAGPWRSQPGGGPALINLIHEIGVMRHLCGEIVDVQAFASSAVRSFPVEDTLAVSLRFVNGCLGTFILSDAAASSKSWEMTSGENQAYPFHAEDYAYHLAGTGASLDFPSMKARSYGADEPASWWRAFDARTLDTTRADPLRKQIAHFVDVIGGVAAPIVSARDGYNNMVVVDAILRAARDQRSVSIPH